MKVAWQGTLLAIQPRIRLARSFDERSHMHLGYALRLDGTIGGQRGEFLVGIGTSTQAKHRFRAGDVVQGESVSVAEPRTEPVDFYKTARLKLLTRGRETAPPPPPLSLRDVLLWSEGLPAVSAGADAQGARAPGRDVGGGGLGGRGGHRASGRGGVRRWRAVAHARPRFKPRADSEP